MEKVEGRVQAGVHTDGGVDSDHVRVSSENDWGSAVGPCVACLLFYCAGPSRF